MALPVPDPGAKLAEWAGIFLGNVLAAMLKKAGPELREFMIGVIRDAITDKPSEISKQNAALGGVYRAITGVQAKGDVHPSGSRDVE